MKYPEKAYIKAGQALARAATTKAKEARQRIIDLMISTEDPTDRPAASALVAVGAAG